ncbi:bifunctional lytic transglycosylase/C40 family peptidase [Carnobacterium gallinarum]|uniref:bifunctional lytic transglycosylase/C40 family peptidase n=1 Tax=Carnobacterium gallinarum TaxID=2749 RepID=UPI00055547D5|nr:bifunctional lysozyme/C40 family peptidase [Carnobacterium gallinarum]
MKLLKIKIIIAVSSIFLILFNLLIFSTILFADDNDEKSSSNPDTNLSEMNLSEEVIAHQATVEKYCKKYGIEDYVNYILAIMQVESKGQGQDVMQSSESLGLAPNSISTEQSIEQGCKYFSELLTTSLANDCDIDSVIQSYNFGGGFLNYIATHGKQYSYELAESFSKEIAKGQKVDYPNPIAIPINGGWRYNYGNQFYVKLVSQYLTVTQFDDETMQIIMNEALKYQGWRYVFGGASPETSFDCSGLTQWTYGKAGINLPRIAQAQYEATQHISLEQAKAGDLVFFHSTYNTIDYVTHVGIYVGNNKMYHAGDPIGYADLTNSYWQEHLIGAGRIMND